MEGKVFFVLFFLALTGATVTAAGWDYSDGPGGPANWGVNYTHCKHNNSQSPINIERSKVVYDKNLGDFTFTNFDNIPPNTTFDISNNGHSLGIVVDDLDAHVSGGGLDGQFTTHSFHFHWGKDNKGSEHTVDGEHYSSELHIVNYHSKYANLSVAMSASDGLAVLGTFIKVGKENADFARLFKYIKNVTKPKSSLEIPAPFSLTSLLPQDRSSFYRYNGSLTTPPCYDSVTWTVFKEALEMSSDQLNQLRSLHEADNTTMDFNFRPVQPLDGRIVKASFTTPTTQPPTTAATTKTQAFSAVLTVLFGALALVFLAH